MLVCPFLVPWAPQTGPRPNHFHQPIKKLASTFVFLNGYIQKHQTPKKQHSPLFSLLGTSKSHLSRGVAQGRAPSAPPPRSTTGAEGAQTRARRLRGLKLRRVMWVSARHIRANTHTHTPRCIYIYIYRYIDIDRSMYIHICICLQKYVCVSAF